MAVPSHIGRYRVDGLLGKGGMGVVYAAWDPDLQRKVAIKVLGELEVGAGRARLLREARAMAKLSHPNVMTVYEVATDDGEDYIVMELVEGVNLAEWLHAGQPPDAVLRAFLDAGRGLAAAHAAGMIHRDFKPQNVLVRRDGRVVVTDFGLARLDAGRPAPVLSNTVVASLLSVIADEATLVDPGGETLPAAVPSHAPTIRDPRSAELTHAGALLGTPGYMAPEQYLGTADARSDQFAYCVALWEGLTGTLPFAGRTVEDMLAAFERGPTGDPGRLRGVLERGLARDPRERWPSIDALLRALEPRRDRRGWIAAIAGGAALTAGAVVYLLAREAPASAVPLSSLLPAPPPTPLAGAIRHLTYDDGCEEFPSFTPDGKTLVYDGPSGRGYALFALDLDTGRSRRLTDSTPRTMMPSVSPDGRHVAFIRTDAAGHATFVADLDGSNMKRLGTGGLLPIWSADGRAVWLGRNETQLVAIDTGAVLRTLRPLAHVRAGDGVVLPDGRLAIVMFPTQGDQTAVGVALFERDGTPHWLIENAFLEAIALAPDGKAVLVTHMTETGTHELWSVPLDGTPPVAVPGPIQPTNGLAVHGGKIAWSSCEPKPALATLTGDPLHLTPLPTGTWIDMAPAGVPGTQHVVVASDRDRTLKLWVIDLAHEDAPRELPDGGHETSNPAVGGDGLVYSVADTNELFAQPLDGSQPPVKIADHVTGTPAPRRDGTVLVAMQPATGDPELAIVSPTAPAPRRLVAHAITPAASPTSDDIYYVSNAEGERGVVMRRDRAGKSAPLSRALPARAFGTLVVSRDGKRLAALESSRVFIVDISSGKITGTYEAGAAILNGATWIEDTLLVSHVDFQGDLWLSERR